MLPTHPSWRRLKIKSYVASDNCVAIRLRAHQMVMFHRSGKWQIWSDINSNVAQAPNSRVSCHRWAYHNNNNITTNTNITTTITSQQHKHHNKQVHRVGNPLYHHLGHYQNWFARSLCPATHIGNERRTANANLIKSYSHQFFWAQEIIVGLNCSVWIWNSWKLVELHCVC